MTARRSDRASGAARSSMIERVISPGHILLDLEAGAKKRVFEQVGLLLENGNKLGFAQVYDGLFARERLGSTGIGHGVAIPHGRLSGLTDATGVFVRLSTPVAWDAPDKRPVHLVFALLMPEQAINEHLTLLAELAERFSNPRFREALTAAPTAADIHQLLVHGLPDATSDHPDPV